MNVSSLQKKTSTTQSLVLLFLVGLLSLTFLVFIANKVFAATDAPVAPTSTSAIGIQTITYNWTAPAGFSGTKWVVASSTNRVPTASQIVELTPTSTVTFVFNRLATNTAYYLGVAGGDATGATSSFATSSLTYTLADTPGVTTLSAATAQGFTLKINSSTNPTSTTYIVRDTASSTQTRYLQSNGTWGTATATFTYDQLGPVSGTSTTGLATNTLHIISVAAVNGGNVTTTYGTTASIYTLAATPAAATVTSTAVNTLNITVNPGSNPTTASTTFIIRDTTSSVSYYLQSNGTWGTATATFTYAQLGGASGTSTTGLAVNSLHTIDVAAVNVGSAATTSYSSTSTSYTLANTPSSLSVSSGANGFTFSWSGDATLYYAQNTTAGTNSGWISGTSFSVNGVNCGTTHTFNVKGRNGDGTETALTSSVSATTGACGGAIVVGGGATVIPATPATPAVPGVSPASPATPAQVALPASASARAVFVHTLGVGSKGEEVRMLQAKLRELGFFNHPTDTGTFGSVTRAAVIAFQKAQGFSSAPGIVGPATRAALNGTASIEAGAPAASVSGAFVSNLAAGSRGEEVRMLQAKLRELGFFNHPTDTGTFGSVTRAAVIAFQKAQGFAIAPGIVGPATRAALNSL